MGPCRARTAVFFTQVCFFSGPGWIGLVIKDHRVKYVFLK